MIVDRILQIIDFKGISKNKFYNETGLSNGFLDKVKDVGASKIENILNTYPDISPDWLLMGKGAMTKSEGNIAIPANGVVTGIPLVAVTAIGGFGNSTFSISNQDVRDYYVIPKFKTKKIDFMIEVEGSSMYPKYSSGDIVACTVINESSFIQWNKTHVIATKNQGIIIKRVKKGSTDNTLCMISDNQSYDPFEVPKEEIVGFALVVGVIRLE
ncbi:S24 family peptidase [Flavobacterium oreochromis]|uniref:S24 family peptidase n=1 Tax=Flavobacterium oreochromis TaxID=2906078 RepID=UPI001CE64A8C|nr:S24 family peptidase [Flavobacterium oreochromis]QYS86338.1 S24 family peptidase [Flavobacterium oreochromis]